MPFSMALKNWYIYYPNMANTPHLDLFKEKFAFVKIYLKFKQL